MKRPIAIAIAVAVAVGAVVAGTRLVRRARHQSLLKVAAKRTVSECYAPTRRTPARGELLAELARHLQWLAQFRGGPVPMHVETWCAWRIDRDLGLRADLPSAPPARDLPSPATLVGGTRREILERLGDPGCGEWEKTEPRGMRFVPRACSESAHIGYSFYYLPRRWGGGGPELRLFFDEGGICTSARWLYSQ